MSLSVEENNKIIAEFMGWKKTEDGQFWVPNLYPATEDYTGETTFRIEWLVFHSSWDWLMPAIKKFDRIYEENDTVYDTIHYKLLCDEIDDAVTTYEIEPAFKALVNAIQWYTKQKQP